MRYASIGRPLAGLLLASLFWTGCLGPRTVRTPVYKEGAVRVFLRHQEQGGEKLALGFDHPRTISSIRLSRILISLNVRERDQKEERSELKAALPTNLAYEISEGLSMALEGADPDQEAVVMAVQTRRRLGVFSVDYLTSMVAWVKDEALWIHFGEIDARLSDDPSEKPDEPSRDKTTGTFRIVKTPGIRTLGSHTIAAKWQDPVFSKSAPPRTRPGERALRRTVLMEEEGAREGEEDSLGTSLSPEALRALADLEEQRRAGTLSEEDYRERRREILEDRE